MFIVGKYASTHCAIIAGLVGGWSIFTAFEGHGERQVTVFVMGWSGQMSRAK